MSLTTTKTFCFASLKSPSSFKRFFFNRIIVFVIILCLEILILFSSRLFVIVIFSRVSQLWVNVKNSLLSFFVSWNCMRMCVHGCDVSMATNFGSFLVTIAWLNTEFNVFQAASCWFFESCKKVRTRYVALLSLARLLNLYELSSYKFNINNFMVSHFHH